MTFIKQSGLNGGRGAILKALGVEHGAYRFALFRTQGPGRRRAKDRRRRQRRSEHGGKERKDAERYFDHKASLLAKLGRLSKSHQLVLSCCHRFRGEAFHAQRIRAELIRPITQLLFHTVCELTVALPAHAYQGPNPDPLHEDQRFLERFGLLGKGYTLLDAAVLSELRARLTAYVPKDDAALIQMLSEDLLERLDSTDFRSRLSR